MLMAISRIICRASQIQCVCSMDFAFHRITHFGFAFIRYDFLGNGQWLFAEFVECRISIKIRFWKERYTSMRSVLLDAGCSCVAADLLLSEKHNVWRCSACYISFSLFTLYYHSEVYIVHSYRLHCEQSRVEIWSNDPSSVKMNSFSGTERDHDRLETRDEYTNSHDWYHYNGLSAVPAVPGGHKFWYMLERAAGNGILLDNWIGIRCGCFVSRCHMHEACRSYLVTKCID